MPPPVNLKELNRVRGPFDYYSKWILDFSTKIKHVLGDQEFPLSKEAINTFNRFEKSVKDLNGIVPIDEYEKLENDFKSLRKQLNAITATANKSTLINVLRTKMIGFQNFVVLLPLMPLGSA